MLNPLPHITNLSGCDRSVSMVQVLFDFDQVLRGLTENSDGFGCFCRVCGLKREDCQASLIP
jgi:hypothetical protein